MEPNTLAPAPEVPGEIKPGTQSPATDYLDRLSRREIIGTPTAQADEIHAWRQTPGWMALEAAARTIGHLHSTRGLADRLLEATSLGRVVRVVATAQDDLTDRDGHPVPVPIGEQLKAADLAGHWAGQRPKRDGPTIQVGVHTTIQAPPRVPEPVDLTITPKDQDTAGS